MKDAKPISMTKPAKQSMVEIVKNNSTRLFGFIRGRVTSHEDAEDILQEVWYQLSRVVDTSDIEQISAWLFRVARNKITDKHRKMKPKALEDYLNEDEGLFFFQRQFAPRK